MSTFWLATALAVAWAGIGLFVALVLGRLFRAAGRGPQDIANRLIC